MASPEAPAVAARPVVMSLRRESLFMLAPLVVAARPVIMARTRFRNPARPTIRT